MALCMQYVNGSSIKAAALNSSLTVQLFYSSRPDHRRISSGGLQQNFKGRCSLRVPTCIKTRLLFPRTNFHEPRRLRLIRASLDDIEAEKQPIEEDAMERMEKTLETVKVNFNTVRTGRASPALLDRVEVEYYGSLVLLKTIAQISTPDGSTILIQPFDKSSLSAIDKAISKSDLGLTPSNDGSVIRLNIPQLTSERRKEFLKLVGKLAEEGKVALRNVRRDTIKSYEKLEKDKKISADNLKDFSEELQKLTDDYVKKVDEVFKQKEKELLSI